MTDLNNTLFCITCFREKDQKILQQSIDEISNHKLEQRKASQKVRQTCIMRIIVKIHHNLCIASMSWFEQILISLFSFIVARNC